VTIRLTRGFSGCKFSSSLIRRATGNFAESIQQDAPDATIFKHYGMLSIADPSGNWQLDDIEEWFAAYSASGCWNASLSLDLTVTHPQPEGAMYGPPTDRLSMSVAFEGGASSFRQSRINIEGSKRSSVLTIMNIFEEGEDEARAGWEVDESVTAPEQPPLRIFIGHGRSPDWRELEFHLRSVHGYSPEVFESGTRAGHGIRDVLEQNVQADIAFLLVTAEDATAESTLRARQNVVHEAGLFQGRLGYSRAILVVEEGVEMWSNMDGVQQIRYPKGKITAAYGDILGVLRREFDNRR
jgi:predicted nucleotide-binding protein